MPALIGARRSLLAAERQPRIYPRFPFGIPGIEIPIGPSSPLTKKVLKPNGDRTDEWIALENSYPAWKLYIDNPGGPAQKRVVIDGADIVLDEWDVQGLAVFQTEQASNSIFNKCRFDNNIGAQHYIIEHNKDITVTSCDFVGKFTNLERDGFGTAFIGNTPSASGATQIIKRTRMVNAEQNFIKPCGGLIEECSFIGVGWITGAHACIFLSTRTNSDLRIRRNYGNLAPSYNPATMWSAWYQCTSEDGPNTFAKEVDENLCAGGASIFYPGYHAGTGGHPHGEGPYYALTGSNVHDNWCDIETALTLPNGNGYLYNQFESSQLSNNRNVWTGATFSAPPGDITDLSVTFTDSTHTILRFTPVPGAVRHEYWYGNAQHQDMRFIPGDGDTNPTPSNRNQPWPALVGDPSVGITISGPNNGAFPWWRVRAVKTPFLGNKGNQGAGNSTPATTAH